MTGPKYCSTCGGTLATREIAGRPRSVCTGCSTIHYVNPVPASAVVLVENGNILLVKRAVEPKQGLWSLPAGFIEIDETVRECALRELKEETGLEAELDGVVDVLSVFDDPRYVCLLVVFAAHRVGGQLAAGDDAADAAFFGPDDLPPIAFQTHARVIEHVLKGQCV